MQDFYMADAKTGGKSLFMQEVLVHFTSLASRGQCNKKPKRGYSRVSSAVASSEASGSCAHAYETRFIFNASNIRHRTSSPPRTR